jgi:hypothetical protein
MAQRSGRVAEFVAGAAAAVPVYASLHLAIAG